MKSGAGLAVALAAALLASTVSVAASKITAAVQDDIVKGCIGNSALVWADPNAARQLCPCYVQNVIKAPDLMDGQRAYVLAFIGGRAASPRKGAPLSAERQEAAFQYFLGRRMEKGCVAK